MNVTSNTTKAAFIAIEKKETHKFIQIFITSDFLDKFASDDKGNSLLSSAILNSAFDIAEVLSNDSSLINFKGKNGKPPSLAFRADVNEDLLKLLISKGMDINSQSNFGITILHSIATYGNEDDYSTAIGNGADHHIRNNLHESPRDVFRRMGKETNTIKQIEEAVGNGSFKSRPALKVQPTEADLHKEKMINKIKRRTDVLNRTF